jgi:hypothetical protein
MAQEIYTPANVIAGETAIVTDSVTVATGESFSAGAVLGRVTADGKYKLAVATAGDGSETPVAIAVEDVDATAGDVAGVAIYIKCEYNERAVTLGSGILLGDAKDALRPLGIYLKSTVKREG